MQVIRHRSERGAWEMAFSPPHSRLGALVDTYIGYDERDTAFTRRHELPGLNAVMIVNLGDPITIVDTAAAMQVATNTAPLSMPAALRICGLTKMM